MGSGKNEYNASTERDLLRSHASELVKQYVEYDAQNRIAKVYTAGRKAEDGAVCTVTEYIYRDNTTTQMKARKEAPGVWNAAWDVDFTI